MNWRQLALVAMTLLPPPAAISATILLQEPTSNLQGTVVPFGNPSSFGPYIGFVYKNVPSFSLQAGDTIAFDLGSVTLAPIVENIAFARTTVNGGFTEDANGYTTVVATGTASSQGDTIKGNFETVFTVTSAYSFAGGGLLLRLNAAGSFASYSGGGGQTYGSNAGPSATYMNGRYYQDADGIAAYPTNEFGYGGTPDLRIVASGPNPVPTPGSFALMFIGLLGLAGARSGTGRTSTSQCGARQRISTQTKWARSLSEAGP